MNALQWIGAILLLLSAIFIIVVVMLQESKTQNSGAITGESDSFAFKGRSQTREMLLAKMTKIVAVCFFVLTIAVNALLLYLQ